MSFLLKSFIKTSFQNKARFFALFIFSFLTIFLLLTSLSSVKYFSQIKTDIKENQLSYEYKIDYDSRKTSNNKNKATITPLAILGSSNISVNMEENYKYDFASLEINKDDKSDVVISKEEYLQNYNEFNIFNYLNTNS